MTSAPTREPVADGGRGDPALPYSRMNWIAPDGEEAEEQRPAQLDQRAEAGVARAPG